MKKTDTGYGRSLNFGAGVAGHTAAQLLRRKLGRDHEVTVVSPNSRYQWIPSAIWIGIGQMTEKHVTFELAPVYKRMGITFIQARAVSIHTEGDMATEEPFVSIEYTTADKEGQSGKVVYDYLINASGPKLNFEAP